MKTGHKTTSLDQLLLRLKERADRLRAADAALARDLELLGEVAEEQELLAIGALQCSETLLERTRLLASAILAMEALASSKTGPLLTAGTREALERWIMGAIEERPPSRKLTSVS